MDGICRATPACPFNVKPPSVDLSIVNAIAVASQGFTRESELAGCGSMFEVFLPRHESRNSAAASARTPHPVILAVGMSKESVVRAQAAAGEHALILDSSSLGEASLVAELYPGEIDLPGARWIESKHEDRIPRSSSSHRRERRHSTWNMSNRR